MVPGRARLKDFRHQWRGIVAATGPDRPRKHGNWLFRYSTCFNLMGRLPNHLKE